MSFFDYPASTQAGTAPGWGFLDGVSDAQWSRFKAHCEVRRFADGAAIVAAGDVDRSLWVVQAGELGVRVPGRRREHVVGCGTVFGEVAFFDAQPRSADIVAIGNVELLALTYENFERLAVAEPAFAVSLLLDLGRFLSQRLRAADALAAGH